VGAENAREGQCSIGPESIGSDGLFGSLDSDQALVFSLRRGLFFILRSRTAEQSPINRMPWDNTLMEPSANGAGGTDEQRLNGSAAVGGGSRLRADEGIISRFVEDRGSNLATGIAVDARGVDEEVARSIFRHSFVGARHELSSLIGSISANGRSLSTPSEWN
jgi:hypothetical protein